MRFFDLPPNIPHAGTVAGRIRAILLEHEPAPLEPIRTAHELCDTLGPYRFVEPEGDELQSVCEEAAALARTLVDQIASAGCGGDRLGQRVRNLFECLGLGEEGARLSLRAGENPDSLQRP